MAVFTPELAHAVIQLVWRDPNCQKYVHDPAYWRFGRDAGHQRNLDKQKLYHFNPNDDIPANSPLNLWICAGIAKWISSAIWTPQARAQLSKLGLCWVKVVYTEGLPIGNHYAVELGLGPSENDNSIILDFWQTLDLSNPVVLDPWNFRSYLYQFTGAELKNWFRTQYATPRQGPR